MTRPTRAVGYRAVLRLPGVLRVFPAAVLGRLSYATIPLSLLLVVDHASGSFAVTGTAVGAYAVLSLSMPLKARGIDRFGQRRVLPLLSAGFAAALVAMAAAVSADIRAPAVYVALCAAAGLAAPPLGPSMRALWAALTPEPAARQRAYSVDGVVEETLYAVGPLVVGALVAVSGALAALLLSAALNLVGTVLMVTSPIVAAHGPTGRRTGRSRRPLRRQHGRSRRSSWWWRSRWRRSSRSASRSSPGLPPSARASWRGPFRSRGFGLLVGALLGVGLGAGPLDVAVVARAQSAGHPETSGYLFAGLSIGSVAGGLLWGRLSHQRAIAVQLGLLVAMMAAGQAAAALVVGLPLLAVVLVLAGSAGSPVFTVSYLAADDLVSSSNRTEASTWVNTAYNVGLAGGAAAAGGVIDRVGPAAALLGGAVILAATAVVLAASGARLDPSPDSTDDSSAPG